jgi:hypothetical protein
LEIVPEVMAPAGLTPGAIPMDEIMGIRGGMVPGGTMATFPRVGLPRWAMRR